MSVLNSQRPLAVILLMLICPASFADHPSLTLETGSAGPVTTVPANTLPQGRAAISLGVQYINNDEISDAALKAAAGRHEHVHSTASLTELSLNAAYGFTDDLTFGFRMPYVDRQDSREGEHHHGGSGDQVARLGDASGRGDLNLFGQYRFYQSSDRLHNAALQLGVRVPTGTTSELTTSGRKFAVDHQPGSGGWGGLFGTSWSSNFGQLSVDASLLYTLSTAGERNTDVGDALNYNLALAWPLYRREAHESHHGHEHDHVHQSDHGLLRNVDAVIELNGDWRDRVEVNGIEEANTGGNMLYLSPGLRAGLAGGWSAYASVGLPLAENLNGQQSEPEYRVIAGISKSF